MIWAVCPAEDGRLSEASREVLTAALSLKEGRPGSSCALVLFDEGVDIKYPGLDGAYLLSGATGEADSRGRLLAEAISEYRPDMVLAEAGAEMRSVCSIAAELSGGGMTADCTGLGLDPAGGLVSTRPALGGCVTADIICPEKRPQFATVRQGSFEPALPGKAAPELTVYRAKLPWRGAELLERADIAQAGSGLAGSRIVLAGGLGLGSAAAFRKLRTVAAALGAATAASRAAVNAGYAPYRMQVGLSGRSIRPEIYIALGISGAVQHMAGVRRAEKIIAVNTDRRAPIFNCADVGIVADWEEYADGLLEYAKQSGRSPRQG